MLHVFCSLALLISTVAVSQTAPEPLVPIGEDLRTMAVPLDEATASALRGRDWDAAAKGLGVMNSGAMVGRVKADWAFVYAWALVHAGRAAEAGPLLPLIDGETLAPRPYIDLVRGEVLLAKEQMVEALDALGSVPEAAQIHPRAALQRAEVLKKLGRTEEASQVYESLASRDVAGAERALLALARHRGQGSESAYAYLRRLWAEFPGTPEEGEASQWLASSPSKPTWQESARRAERLMERGQHQAAMTLASSVLPSASDESVDACRVRYTLGRSYYKLNQLSNSVLGFGDIGERCVRVDGDYGPRGLYLVGTAEHRRHRYAESAKAYRRLADLYPEHSMADDALTRGGISLQEGGDLSSARAMWREALERFPTGDTGPEAIWRLAFSLYLSGDGVEARNVAARLGALPLSVDAVHVAAGRYWAARWALYPDVSNPGRALPDPSARIAAIEGFADLVVAWPHSFYAILAWSRLRELDPERARQLATRPAAHDPGALSEPWLVRRSFLESPGISAGTALARLGLVQEAMDEWRALESDALISDEMAWLTELRIASGDWLLAHDEMRQWLKTHPVGSLGDREPQVIRVAYPDRYWEIVREASAGDRYEPRLFHALVREESNFNRQIVSFAGARGLSQLMPATAQQTAGWLGIHLSMEDLDDPKINLTIGARYLDAMHKDLGESPYLSLAAYNAGAGRVRQWLGEWGNVPTDEYVERIPFRETREYVKRVMGTWQTMRWQFDTESDGFYDLSAFNHRAMTK